MILVAMHASACCLSCVTQTSMAGGGGVAETLHLAGFRWGLVLMKENSSKNPCLMDSGLRFSAQGPSYAHNTRSASSIGRENTTPQTQSMFS